MRTATHKKQHSMSSLFSQLALPCDEVSIHRFARDHRLPSDTLLAEAFFWNEQQLDFIKEAIWMDSDWVIPLERLDFLLRK